MRRSSHQVQADKRNDFIAMIERTFLIGVDSQGSPMNAIEVCIEVNRKLSVEERAYVEARFALYKFGKCVGLFIKEPNDTRPR